MKKYYFPHEARKCTQICEVRKESNISDFAQVKIGSGSCQLCENCTSKDVVNTNTPSITCKVIDIATGSRPMTTYERIKYSSNITEEKREKALAGLVKMRMNKAYGKKTIKNPYFSLLYERGESILSLFIWKYTDEGAEFWKKIYKKVFKT